MNRRTIIQGAILAAIIAVAVSVGSAQDLDAKSIAGTWRGTTPSPAGGDDQREIAFRDDGKFTGNVQSVRGGLILVSGTYKIVGDELRLDGIYDDGPQVLKGTKFTMALKRRGDDLEGTGHSWWNNRKFPVSLKRGQ